MSDAEDIGNGALWGEILMMTEVIKLLIQL